MQNKTLKIGKGIVVFSMLFICSVSCKSILSRLNSGVKESATKVAAAGRYRVTGGDVGCTCKTKVTIRLEPISGATETPGLCISQDHEQLVEYARLHSGDVVSFELVDDMLDWECNGSPATFLRIKK